jgi:hypothetical protein
MALPRFVPAIVRAKTINAAVTVPVSLKTLDYGTATTGRRTPPSPAPGNRKKGARGRAPFRIAPEYAAYSCDSLAAIGAGSGAGAEAGTIFGLRPGFALTATDFAATAFLATGLATAAAAAFLPGGRPTGRLAAAATSTFFTEVFPAAAFGAGFSAAGFAATAFFAMTLPVTAFLVTAFLVTAFLVTAFFTGPLPPVLDAAAFFATGFAAAFFATAFFTAGFATAFFAATGLAAAFFGAAFLAAGFFAATFLVAAVAVRARARGASSVVSSVLTCKTPF